MRIQDFWIDIKWIEWGTYEYKAIKKSLSGYKAFVETIFYEILIMDPNLYFPRDDS